MLFWGKSAELIEHDIHRITTNRIKLESTVRQFGCQISICLAMHAQIHIVGTDNGNHGDMVYKFNEFFKRKIHSFSLNWCCSLPGIQINREELKLISRINRGKITINQ